MNEESAEVEEKNFSFMKIEICDFSSFEKGTEMKCGQFLKHQKEAPFFDTILMCRDSLTGKGRGVTF